MTKKFFSTKWEGMNEIGEGETVPMSKKLKPNQFMLLSAIAMYQGQGGTCDTTQQQLSDVLPYSRKIIGSTLESLIEFRYAGNPVLEREEIVGFNKKKQWAYRILPNPLFTVYGESCVETTHNDQGLWEETTHNTPGLCVETTHSKEVKDSKEVKRTKEVISKPKEESRMNKKEIILYFANLLEGKGIQPDVNVRYMYARMKSTGVTELLTDFQDETIKKILEVIVNEYGTGKIRSDLVKYPLEMKVLTRMWVVEKAVQLVSQSEAQRIKEESQLQERAVISNERQEKAIQSIMERIRKGKSE